MKLMPSDNHDDEKHVACNIDKGKQPMYSDEKEMKPNFPNSTNIGVGRE